MNADWRGRGHSGMCGLVLEVLVYANSIVNGWRDYSALRISETTGTWGRVFAGKLGGFPRIFGGTADARLSNNRQRRLGTMTSLLPALNRARVAE